MCFLTLSQHSTRFCALAFPIIAFGSSTSAADTPPGVILDHSPPAAGATLTPTWIAGRPKGFRDTLTLKDTVTVKSCNGETLTASGPIPGHGYREFTLKYRYVPDGRDVRGGWYDGRESQSGFAVALKFPNFKKDEHQGADYTVTDDSDPKDIRLVKVYCAINAPGSSGK